MNTLLQAVQDFMRYLARRRSGPDHANRFGDMRGTVPIARAFGFDRGTPVDRYYIECFLRENARHIRGRVMEIGDNSYTLAYGGREVTQSDILHYDASNPRATITGDLSNAGDIPGETFDCVILTQTLHLIYDIRGALSHVHRILRPGGVLLATFPGISQISDEDWGPSWCWGWSRGQGQALLEETFPGGDVSVIALGNRFAALAFLQGLVVEELERDDLDTDGQGIAFLLGAIAMRAS